MRKPHFFFTALCVATAVGSFSKVYAIGLDEIHTALSEGKTELSMRYRYEFVDQDGIEKNANASTVLTRLSYTSADIDNFFAVLEADNVTAVANENFNSTVNGRSQYPVVADPTGTELNQAYLGYRAGDTLITYGRQRITHNDQRFVGGVAWRQNEQTYDGLRVLYGATSKLTIDYSYVYNVNRIFGTDSVNSDWHGDTQLFNVNYAASKHHRFTGFAYNLDFDNAFNVSSRTLGLSYDLNVEPFSVHASLATQTDIGNNPDDYTAEYFTLEGGIKLSGIKYSLGYESLGSDNDVGFKTPLATLHKFQGFADKFLSTPDAGLNDLYLKAEGKLGKLSVTGVYHHFESSENSIDYGSELNLVAAYPVNKKVKLLLKYAKYSADELATDTQKFWAMAAVKF